MFKKSSVSFLNSPPSIIINGRKSKPAENGAEMWPSSLIPSGKMQRKCALLCWRYFRIAFVTGWEGGRSVLRRNSSAALVLICSLSCSRWPSVTGVRAHADILHTSADAADSIRARPRFNKKAFINRPEKESGPRFRRPPATTVSPAAECFQLPELIKHGGEWLGSPGIVNV